jgi:hypothetical protein
MKMHQVDAAADFEWNLLVASQSEADRKETTQQFFVEASLLARKWQDKVGTFQGVKQRPLELVPELGPSFQKVKEEEAQTEEPKEEEKKDKGTQQMLLENVKEPST